MYLKQNLKYLREDFSLTQEDLGILLGKIPKQSISNWENGVSQPSLEILIKLSEIYGVTLDELILTELKPPIPMYAKNLRYLREKAELKQGDIASLLRVKQSTIALYETNKRGMDVEDLLKVADFFGVTMDQMIKRDLSKEI